MISNNLFAVLCGIKYSNLVLIICIYLNGFKKFVCSVMWYKVFQSSTNNLYIFKWFQISISNTYNFRTDPFDPEAIPVCVVWLVFLWHINPFSGHLMLN